MPTEDMSSFNDLGKPASRAEMSKGVHSWVRQGLYNPGVESQFILPHLENEVVQLEVSYNCSCCLFLSAEPSAPPGITAGGTVLGCPRLKM